MDRVIRQAIESPRHSYAELAERAAVMCEEFLASHGYSLYREMGDYESVKMVLWLDGELNDVRMQDPNSRYTIIAILSLRGSFFTFVFMEGRMKRVWYPLPAADVSGKLKTYEATLQAFLEQRGYQLLAGPVLDELAPGHTTELDGIPATVFQVLFSELV